MRILYVGPLWYGGTCLQRMEAMKDLGHELLPVDTKPDHVRRKQRKSSDRVIRRILGPLDMAGANRAILEAIEGKRIDVLWIDKGLTIWAETLIQTRLLSPTTVVAGYSPDDMAAKHNRSRGFVKGLRYYDVYFTTKSYNVQELKDLGCQSVVFVPNSYDPKTHRPMSITREDRLKLGGPVGFIGDFEEERMEAILYLAARGIPIRVWGPNWGRKCNASHPNLKVEGRSLWGSDYAKAICSFDINLVFLRKANRDLQTTRSIEIPACGAFMVAERTDEHLELFHEGKEAEFFGTSEELLGKVKYYLVHQEERRKIARAGRERCLKGTYSNNGRLKSVLSQLASIRTWKKPDANC